MTRARKRKIAADVTASLARDGNLSAAGRAYAKAIARHYLGLRATKPPHAGPGSDAVEAAVADRIADAMTEYANEAGERADELRRRAGVGDTSNVVDLATARTRRRRREAHDRGRTA